MAVTGRSDEEREIDIFKTAFAPNMVLEEGALVRGIGEEGERSAVWELVRQSHSAYIFRKRRSILIEFDDVCHEAVSHV